MENAVAQRCKHGLPEASCGVCGRPRLDAGYATDSAGGDVKNESSFHADMVEIYRKTGEQFGYWPTRYLQMVRKRGGVATAKKLLEARDVSDGFMRLVRERRLDLSVEYLVLKPRYASLFTDKERALARDRLSAYGIDVPPG